MSILEKIKAEIERRIANGKDGYGGNLKALIPFITSLQQEQRMNCGKTEKKQIVETGGIKGILEEIPSNVDLEKLEKYISNNLRELGADLINHKPYSFNRGLNVGKTYAYDDILNRLKARKEK